MVQINFPNTFTALKNLLLKLPKFLIRYFYWWWLGFLFLLLAIAILIFYRFGSAPAAPLSEGQFQRKTEIQKKLYQEIINRLDQKEETLRKNLPKEYPDIFK